MGLTNIVSKIDALFWSHTWWWFMIEHNTMYTYICFKCMCIYNYIYCNYWFIYIHIYSRTIRIKLQHINSSINNRYSMFIYVLLLFIYICILYVVLDIFYILWWWLWWLLFFWIFSQLYIYIQTRGHREFPQVNYRKIHCPTQSPSFLINLFSPRPIVFRMFSR